MVSNIKHKILVITSISNVHKGSVSAEYILPLVFVGLGLVSLPFMLTALHSLFQSDLKATLSGNTLTLLPLGQKAVKSKPFSNELSDQKLQANLNGNASDTLSNVTGLSTASVETMGSNGYTLLASNSLVNLSQKLLQSGQISTLQSNDLMALANQAYRIGAVESLVEATAKNANNDVDVFMGTSITFEGKTYANPVDLINATINTNVNRMTLRENGITPATIFSTDPSVLLGEESTSSVSSSFINLLNQAHANGSLKDPAVQSVVGTLAIGILKGGNSQANAASMGAIDRLSSNLTSTTTRQSGGAICSVGQGNASGETVCQ